MKSTKLSKAKIKSKKFGQSHNLKFSYYNKAFKRKQNTIVE